MSQGQENNADDAAAQHGSAKESAVAQPGAQRGISARVGRARHLVRQNPVTRLVWQVLVGLVGAGLLIAGGAMLVLPGPGWAVIALGLVILASEFVWFERPLRPVRKLIERTGVTSGSPRRKWLVVAVAILGTVGGMLVWLWGTRQGWNLPGMR